MILLAKLVVGLGLLLWGLSYVPWGKVKDWVDEGM